MKDSTVGMGAVDRGSRDIILYRFCVDDLEYNGQSAKWTILVVFDLKQIL
jgi:hypothetical protein